VVDRSSPIAIIGAGRLGSALAHALLRAGRPLDTVASAHRETADALAEQLPFVGASEVAEAIEGSGLVFLAIPDDVIRSFVGEHRWRPDQAVVHLSGGLGLDALAPATEAAALAGCLHPLQTFPRGDSPAAARARFEGIACGVEAAEPLGSLLESIADDLGARTFRLEGIDRAAYHAAAVFVSNDVVASMVAATRAWELAGLPAADARASLSPLLTATAAAIANLELVDALTGPVARGDLDTIRRHLAGLEPQPDLRELYRRLAAELLRLDLGHPPEVTGPLAALLNSDRP